MRKFLIPLVLLCAATSPAMGQSAYPSRPVTMIVPFPAGGALDIVARVLAKEMTPLMGQAVVVENRAGAAGTIGSAFVSKAPAAATPCYLVPWLHTRSALRFMPRFSTMR